MLFETWLALAMTTSQSSSVVESAYICWSNLYPTPAPFYSENMTLRYLAEGHSGADKRALEEELEAWVRKEEPSLYHGSSNCQIGLSEEGIQSRRASLMNAPQIKTVPFTLGAQAKLKPKTDVVDHDESETSAESQKTATQTAAEGAAASKAKYEAEFQAKQAEYERKLAEQQKQVEDFKKAQEEVERTKAANQAKADAAAAKFKAEQEAFAEQARLHAEREAAAQKLREDWDKRHGFKAKQAASTSTDANRCVTSPELQLNASFKGNTAASVTNGCGEPVDVRICLMTSKGWNCGASYGVGSQRKWSWSSFDATGPVFVDARVSSSSRPLAQPQ